MKDFIFCINQLVVLAESGEAGTVIGRAQYAPGDYPENQYKVRYVNAAGCLTEAWWNESLLKAA